MQIGLEKFGDLVHGLFVEFAVQNAIEGEGEKLETLSAVELVLELHPVQAQGVQEGRQPLHDEQDAHGERGES